MKGAPKKRPIDHLSPDLKPERVQRMWQAIAAAQQRPTRRARAWLVAAAAALVLGALGSYYLTQAPDSSAARVARQGQRIVTEQRATDLTLPDGTSLALSRASALAVLATDPQRGDARLRVERGQVRFDVPHREGRSFVVEVRELRVVVRGTRFVVSVDERTTHTEIQVGVERGRVEVQDRAGRVLSTLQPNQSWSMQITPAAAAASPTPASPAAAPTPDVPVTAPGEPAEAPAAVPGAGAGGAVQAATSGAATAAASSLLEHANRARIQGQTAEAAADYERVYRRYPRDPRAGLAAFELARIRLDSLHDARGALVALRFALGHNQGGYLAEDAAALRIDALQRTGDLAACREARDSFLQRHPGSAHARRVQGACAD